MKREIVKCKKCGKSFPVFLCLIRTRKYCSNECRKNGTIKTCLVCKKEYYIAKGNDKGSKYCGVKCKGVDWGKRIKGEKHHNWLGYYGDYFTIHKYLEKNFKKKGICQFCNNARKTTWALIKGKVYKKDINNYYELCYPCHKNYDLN